MSLQLDLLAFGAHPDDVELACSGLLLAEKSRGKKTGVVDLTRGELGTRGSAAIRDRESAAATAILELDVRENLGLVDGFFRNDETNQKLVIRAIRSYRPSIICCNAPEDRHPDHGRSAELVSDAAFLSGLQKIETVDLQGRPQEPWRPAYVLHYIQDRYLQPNFIVDISNVMEQKLASIKAYATQFHNPELNEPSTYISTPEFLESIINRSKMMGRMIGVPYGEGFISRKTIGIKSLDALIANPT